MVRFLIDRVRRGEIVVSLRQAPQHGRCGQPRAHQTARPNEGTESRRDDCRAAPNGINASMRKRDAASMSSLTGEQMRPSFDAGRRVAIAGPAIPARPASLCVSGGPGAGCTSQ